VRFTGWQKCPLAFSGIRITVIDIAVSPRAPLGFEGKAKIGKMLLNFTMNTPVTPSSDPTRTLSLRKRCAEKGVGIDQCIASSVVHEFGHVLGLSHEQNRPDDLSSVLCHRNDPETIRFPEDGISQFLYYHLWGNTYFTPYVPNSVMNYCRIPYYGNTNLSNMDKVAVKVYYGNIPGFSTPLGWNGLVGNGLRVMIIPKLMISNLPYYGTLTESSIDSNHDGKYDNLYSLTTTYNPSVQSTSPVSLVGTVTKVGNVLIIKAGSKINIPLFKYSSAGKVVRVGYASLTKRTDGWWVFNTYKYFYY
jgi:Astacin (Peptidase family M12A)